jgi:hypothetical protein
MRRPGACADNPSGNKGENMSYDENERAAYMAGDTVLAGLYHRLDQLTQALGEAVAEIEELKKEITRAENRADDLQMELDRANT